MLGAALAAAICGPARADDTRDDVAAIDAPAALAEAGRIICPKCDPRRVDAVAGSIARAASTPEDQALLLVTAVRESALRLEVETCRVVGDGGRAVSSYQLWRHHWRGHTRSEICSDPALAAGLALGALRFGRTVRARIAAFMGRGQQDPEVSRRVRLYGVAMRIVAGES